MLIKIIIVILKDLNLVRFYIFLFFFFYFNVSKVLIKIITRENEILVIGVSDAYFSLIKKFNFYKNHRLFYVIIKFKKFIII